MAKKHASEIIVYDDGSTDMTSEIAKAAGATVISGGQNMGKGVALRRLFEEAKKLNADAVVTLDADGQHSPDDIPAVAKPILAGAADLVIGVRPMKNGVMPLTRRIGNRVLDALVSMHADLDLHDTQSGFRAYSQEAIRVIEFREPGMSVEAQSLIDALRVNLRIAEVPIFTTYKGIKPKRSITSQFAEISDFVLTATVARSPIKFLGVPGIVAIVIGLVVGIGVVVTFTSTRQLAVGLALLSAVLLVTGTIALATSVIVKLVRH